jgi:anti-sigma-K factor RskA
MKSREEIRDDLSLYALGSLEPEERSAVETAVAQDAELARELREWTEMVGLLALDAPDAAPPDVREALLSRVRDAVPAVAESRVARRRIGWHVPLAAAAALLLAVVGYREVGFRAERARLTQTLAAAQGALTARDSELNAARTALDQREGDVASLKAALALANQSLDVVQQRGLTMVSLSQTEDAPPAEAHILLSPPTGRALFYAFDLPSIPTDKVYELWWITEKQGPVRAAVFHPDAQGFGRVEAQLPTDAGAIQAAAVTVEVSPGGPKPAGPMVLLGKAS